MRRVSSGYTIIEVMIFLAISLVIAAASWNLISGQQEQTEFNQKMRDTQSKIQDWINDVSTGFTGGDPSQQSCVIVAQDGANRPHVESVAPSSTYSPSCTFLGKAIQFYNDPTGANAQSSTLYTYPVFGCRIANCADTGTSPGSMLDANPQLAAIGQNPNPSANLTEAFDLGPAHVSAVCSLSQAQAQNPQTTCDPNSSSHLIGFMNNFNTQGNSAVNGSENLNAYVYSLNNNTAPATDFSDTSVVHCIEGVAAGPCALSSANPNPPSLKSFWFCLTDSTNPANGGHFAQITITSTSGTGASVQLDYLSKSDYISKCSS